MRSRYSQFSHDPPSLLFRLHQELMEKAGVPATVQFSNNTKKQDKENGSLVEREDLPDWAFLHLDFDADEKDKRKLFISNDGKTINKKAFTAAKTVIKYEKKYNNPVDWVQQPDIDKCVALAAYNHSQ